MLLLIFLAANTVTAECKTSTPAPLAPPKCSDYPDGYFITDFSNCQGYFFCPNSTSPPMPGKCSEPFNFDQTHQMCNQPNEYSCQLNENIAKANVMKVAIKYHNKYRKIHSSPNVSNGGSKINKFAQKWADYLAKTNKFHHSGGSYGENLYKMSGGSKDAIAVVVNAIKSFYKEIKFYDFKKPKFNKKTGHFTQLVWKASTKIGVGVATYPDKNNQHRTVVCINYKPPGNVKGQFPKNVLPPKKVLDLNDLDVMLDASNFTETIDEHLSSEFETVVYPIESSEEV